MTSVNLRRVTLEQLGTSALAPQAYVNVPLKSPDASVSATQSLTVINASTDSFAYIGLDAPDEAMDGKDNIGVGGYGTCYVTRTYGSGTLPPFVCTKEIHVGGRDKAWRDTIRNGLRSEARYAPWLTLAFYEDNEAGIWFKMMSLGDCSVSKFMEQARIATALAARTMTASASAPFDLGWHIASMMLGVACHLLPAHREEYVHDDVNLRNMLLQDHTIRLIDWDFCTKSLDEHKGNPHYDPPERWLSVAAQRELGMSVDSSSSLACDIYGLGLAGLDMLNVELISVNDDLIKYFRAYEQTRAQCIARQGKPFAAGAGHVGQNTAQHLADAWCAVFERAGREWATLLLSMVALRPQERPSLSVVVAQVRALYPSLPADGRSEKLWHIPQELTDARKKLENELAGYDGDELMVQLVPRQGRSVPPPRPASRKPALPTPANAPSLPLYRPLSLPIVSPIAQPAQPPAPVPRAVGVIPIVGMASAPHPKSIAASSKFSSVSLAAPAPGVPQRPELVAPLAAVALARPAVELSTASLEIAENAGLMHAALDALRTKIADLWWHRASQLEPLVARLQGPLTRYVGKFQLAAENLKEREKRCHETGQDQQATQKAQEEKEAQLLADAVTLAEAKEHFAQRSKKLEQLWGDFKALRREHEGWLGQFNASREQQETWHADYRAASAELDAAQMQQDVDRRELDDLRVAQEATGQQLANWRAEQEATGLQQEATGLQQAAVAETLTRDRRELDDQRAKLATLRRRLLDQKTQQADIAAQQADTDEQQEKLGRELEEKCEEHIALQNGLNNQRAQLSTALKQHEKSQSEFYERRRQQDALSTQQQKTREQLERLERELGAQGEDQRKAREQQQKLQRELAAEGREHQRTREQQAKRQHELDAQGAENKTTTAQQNMIKAQQEKKQLEVNALQSAVRTEQASAEQRQQTRQRELDAQNAKQNATASQLTKMAQQQRERDELQNAAKAEQAEIATKQRASQRELDTQGLEQNALGIQQAAREASLKGWTTQITDWVNAREAEFKAREVELQALHQTVGRREAELQARHEAVGRREAALWGVRGRADNAQQRKHSI